MQHLILVYTIHLTDFGTLSYQSSAENSIGNSDFFLKHVVMKKVTHLLSKMISTLQNPNGIQVQKMSRSD